MPPVFLCIKLCNQLHIGAAYLYTMTNNLINVIKLWIELLEEEGAQPVRLAGLRKLLEELEA